LLFYEESESSTKDSLINTDSPDDVLSCDDDPYAPDDAYVPHVPYAPYGLYDPCSLFFAFFAGKGIPPKELQKPALYKAVA
jgi:hypothetical protein